MNLIIPVVKRILEEKSGLPKPMRCDVVFGSPKHECRGTGICKIELAAQRAPGQRDCTRTEVYLSGSACGNYLIFEVQQSALCLNLYRNIFQKKIFYLPEDYFLPVLKGAFWQAGRNFLPAGYYSIDRYGDKYVLLFDLVKV